MKALWFKSEFVAPILAGEKRDTVRVASSRLPGVDEVVRLTVGPWPPFAHARIERVEPVNVEELTDDRRAQLATFIDSGKPLLRLIFSV